jgi:hypothetical protein
VHFSLDQSLVHKNGDGEIPTMDPGDPIFWKSESFYPLVNMAITAIFMVDLHMKHGDFP